MDYEIIRVRDMDAAKVFIVRICNDIELTYLAVMDRGNLIIKAPRDIYIPNGDDIITEIKRIYWIGSHYKR